MYKVQIIFLEVDNPLIFESLLFIDLLSKFIELFHLAYFYFWSYFDIFETLEEYFEFLLHDKSKFAVYALSFFISLHYLNDVITMSLSSKSTDNFSLFNFYNEF